MTTLSLETPLEQLTRVGKTAAARLRHLGLSTVADLLRHYPSRHDDFGNVLPIGQLRPGTVATVRGRIELIANRRSPRRHLMLTEAVVADATGTIQAVWFNQPYLVKNFHPGDEVYLAGQVVYEFHQLQYVNPSIEAWNPQTLHTARLVPIYPTTEGLTQRQIRFLMRQALPAARHIADPLPLPLCQRQQLVPLPEAIGQIHFPDDQHRLQLALRRLKFDELFGLQLVLGSARQQSSQRAAHSVPFQAQATKKFVARLGFSLTVDQRKAAWQILQDISQTVPMSRMLEGEVGSGKTVVVAIPILNVALAGLQSAVMAPTEILAEQHYRTFCRLLEGFSVSVALLTSSRRAIQPREKTAAPRRAITKRQLASELSAGTIDVVVGTHALLQEHVAWRNLALAVVDEQHRFGVLQRQRLKSAAPVSAGAADPPRSPHFLSLSATPIPRSLALVLHGDVALTTLRQLPSERKPIRTQIITPASRPRLYQFIREQVAAGRQVFVVCPLIDPADVTGVRSTTMEAENLRREVFPDFKIGVLHGKLSADKKAAVMADFQQGKCNLLVATTVVEVGVDIPNASTIVIEGVERFGLAQLHQLRGRVGRAHHQSYCFLCTESNLGTTDERLSEFLRAKDGFAVAELDLKYRGAGQLLGTEQSGFLGLKLASLADLELAALARDEAQKILADDPTLSRYPLLSALVSTDSPDRVHLE